MAPIFDDMSKRVSRRPQFLALLNLLQQIGFIERLSPLLEEALTDKLNEVYAVVHARHLHLDSIAVSAMAIAPD